MKIIYRIGSCLLFAMLPTLMFICPLLYSKYEKLMRSQDEGMVLTAFCAGIIILLAIIFSWGMNYHCLGWPSMEDETKETTVNNL